MAQTTKFYNRFQQKESIVALHLIYYEHCMIVDNYVHFILIPVHYEP